MKYHFEDNMDNMDGLLQKDYENRIFLTNVFLELGLLSLLGIVAGAIAIGVKRNMKSL